MKKIIIALALAYSISANAAEMPKYDVKTECGGGGANDEIQQMCEHNVQWLIDVVAMHWHQLSDETQKYCIANSHGILALGSCITMRVSEGNR